MPPGFRFPPSGLQDHARCRSLSIGSTWPLIDLAASEARNTASAAISFGSIIALIDCAAIASARTSSTVLPLIWAQSAKTRSMRSPSTAPGAIALARMSHSHECYLAGAEHPQKHLILHAIMAWSFCATWHRGAPSSAGL
jgi:hypothetical protein